MNSKILKEEYRKYFQLEYPYGAMIEELVHSLYEKNGDVQGNYLTAIGLFCYSEAVGREIMYYKNSTISKERLDGKKCFDLFLKEYMDYGELLNKYEQIYSWYRNGLCHQYKIKGPNETGVFVYYHPNSIKNFQNAGVDTTKGILLSEISPKRIFILLSYLKDFIRGIEKFINEKNKK